MDSRNQTILALTVALSLITAPFAEAQKPLSAKKTVNASPVPDGEARVVDLFGRVGKRFTGAGDFTTLSSGGVTLTAGTTLRTGDDSAILFLLPGGNFLRVGEKTVVILDGLTRSKGFSFKVLSGQAWVAMGDPRTACEVQTPSSKTRTPVSPANGSHAPALFGVGYDLEVDQSMVSVADGKAAVSIPGVGWKAAVQSGQYVRYLRQPQPNIRLRNPEVLAQDAAQKQMWEFLRAEKWTKPTPFGNNGAKLTRGQEKRVRQLTFSVSVEN